MPHSTISKVLNQIADINAASDQIELKLADRSRYFLSKSKNPKFALWARLIAQQVQQVNPDPLFVAGEPGTSNVDTILPPLSRMVREFREVPSRHIAIVTFVESPATFTLSANHRGYSSLKRLFNQAQKSGDHLWVAANPLSLEILHAVKASVRATTATDDLPAQCSKEVVTYAEAAKAFYQLKNSSGIPFGYLPDCCNARAHKMCLLLVEYGFKPCKVWNYGQGFVHQQMPTIQVQTSLQPSGFVKWSYHVAPLLLCKDFGNYDVPVVLDPALFDRPVSLDQWVDVQQDPNSEVEISGPKPFHRELKGKPFFDPGFIKTERALAAHRYSLAFAASAELELRP